MVVALRLPVQAYAYEKLLLADVAPGAMARIRAVADKDWYSLRD